MFPILSLSEDLMSQYGSLFWYPEAAPCPEVAPRLCVDLEIEIKDRMTRQAHDITDGHTRAHDASYNCWASRWLASFCSMRRRKQFQGDTCDQRQIMNPLGSLVDATGTSNALIEVDLVGSLPFALCNMVYHFIKWLIRSNSGNDELFWS